MDYCRTITHVVEQGDTFYRLAQRYHTTVPDITMRNPGVNPYNMQVGTRLRICPGYEAGGNRPEEQELNNDMRQAWSQHNFWDTMFMISLFNSLGNLDAVQQRLIQTPGDIAAVFEQFYAQPTVNQLRQLLTNHVQLAGELTTAMKNQNTEQAAQLSTQLNQNADQIARLLASVNSHYSYDELRRMLRRHLDLMRDTMTTELNGEHEDAVQLINENENTLQELADILTEGLLQQFYQR